MKYFHAIGMVILGALAAGAADVRLEANNTSPRAGGRVIVRIVVDDVEDLDTYGVKVSYDPAALELVAADIEAPSMGITNTLRRHGRTLLPLVKKQPGLVHIAATLTGNGDGLTAEEAVVGVIAFTVRREKECVLKLTDTRLLNSRAEPLEGNDESKPIVLNEGL